MFRRPKPPRPDWGQITARMRSDLLALGDDGQSPRDVLLSLRRAALFASNPHHLRARLDDLHLGPVESLSGDIVLRARLNPFADEIDQVTRSVEDLSRSHGWVLEERSVCIVEGR